MKPFKPQGKQQNHKIGATYNIHIRLLSQYGIWTISPVKGHLVFMFLWSFGSLLTTTRGLLPRLPATKPVQGSACVVDTAAQTAACKRDLRLVPGRAIRFESTLNCLLLLMHDIIHSRKYNNSGCFKFQVCFGIPCRISIINRIWVLV